MLPQKCSLDKIDNNLEREKSAVEALKQDLIQLLSHDQTPTRRQFALLLRRQADLVESDAQIDLFL